MKFEIMVLRVMMGFLALFVLCTVLQIEKMRSTSQGTYLDYCRCRLVDIPNNVCTQSEQSPESEIFP